MKSKNIWLVVGIVVLIVAIIVGIRLGPKPAPQEQSTSIGAVLPLTGNAGRYGQYIRQALELAREEINQSNDINGRKLQIIYEDDQGEPKIASSVMSKLVEVNGVPIVFGSWASSCVLAQAPIAENTHTPILAEAQSPQIRDAGDYVFRIQPDSRHYLRILVPYVHDELGIREAAILYVNNDFGHDQALVFKELFESLGGNVISSEGFKQGTIEFRSLLEKLKTLKPQAVFIPAYTEAGYILKQGFEIGLKAQFIGSAPLENPDIAKIAGQGGEGVIYPHHFDPESRNPRVQEFRKKYKLRFGEEPEGYAALAYDGLYVISHILKECNRDKECIKDAFYKIQNFPGVTGQTSFDDHGDVLKPIVIRTIRNGIFRTLKSWEAQ